MDEKKLLELASLNVDTTEAAKVAEKGGKFQNVLAFLRLNKVEHGPDLVSGKTLYMVYRDCILDKPVAMHQFMTELNKHLTRSQIGTESFYYVNKALIRNLDEKHKEEAEKYQEGIYYKAPPKLKSNIEKLEELNKVPKNLPQEEQQVLEQKAKELFPEGIAQNKANLYKENNAFHYLDEKERRKLRKRAIKARLQESPGPEEREALQKELEEVSSPPKRFR